MLSDLTCLGVILNSSRSKGRFNSRTIDHKRSSATMQGGSIVT